MVRIAPRVSPGYVGGMSFALFVGVGSIAAVLGITVWLIQLAPDS